LIWAGRRREGKITEGSPEEIVKKSLKKSYTAQYLKNELKQSLGARLSIHEFISSPISQLHRKSS
jgi:hypothetical protein